MRQPVPNIRTADSASNARRRAGLVISCPIGGKTAGGPSCVHFPATLLFRDESENLSAFLGEAVALLSRLTCNWPIGDFAATPLFVA